MLLSLIMMVKDPDKRSILMEIYHSYKDKMIYYAFTIVDDIHIAEDIFQNIVVKLAEKPHLLKYTDLEHNLPYIYTMIKHNCYTHLRYLKKNRPIENLDENPDGLEDFSILFEDEDTFKYVVAEMMKLPEKYRQVMVLRYQHEFTDNEISDVLGISVENVRVRIFRAIKLIKQKVREKEAI